MQRVYPKLFRACVVLIVIGSVRSKAFGLTQSVPVGGFVASAFESLNIGERFCQQGLVAMNLLPLSGQSLQCHRQAAAGQIWHTHSLEQQKASILDNQIASVSTLASIPADPLVAVDQFQCCRAPIKQGNSMPLVLNDLEKSFAAAFDRAKIVLALEQLIGLFEFILFEES